MALLADQRTKPAEAFTPAEAILLLNRSASSGASRRQIVADDPDEFLRGARALPVASLATAWRESVFLCR
jgi:hypothetical protein